MIDQTPTCSLINPPPAISQVRPKPQMPNNVPIAPAPPPPMVAAPLIQRPLMLATKLTSSLPASAGPIHQVRIVNGQQVEKAMLAGGTAQVTGIVISPAQTLQISNLYSDAKVRNDGEQCFVSSLIDCVTEVSEDGMLFAFSLT